MHCHGPGSYPVLEALEMDGKTVCVCVCVLMTGQKGVEMQR